MVRVVRKFSISLLLISVISALGIGAANAQTISQTVGNNVVTAAPAGLGQNFTATVTGTVTEIQVRPRSTQPSTVYFFNGTGSGTNGSNATAVSSQIVNLADTGSNIVGLQTIILNTPLSVVAGNQYSFAFDNNPALAVNTGDPYVGGNLITTYNLQRPDIGDLVFTVTEVAIVPVPTLTEWALIIFGLALAGSAALYIQRRQAMS